MPFTVFIIVFATIMTIMIGAGILLTLSPKRFVLIYQKIAIGDYYARNPIWGNSLRGPEGRAAGIALCCFGVGGIYFLLKWMKLL